MNEIIRLAYFNGLPGAGKDSQARRLIGVFGGQRVSTGEILRGATPDGEFSRFYPLVQPYASLIRKGVLLPQEVVLDIFEKYMGEQIEDGVNTFALTGFPRSIGQERFTEQWHQRLRESGYQVEASHVLCDIDTLTSHLRVKSRREYAVINRLPTREDDTFEVVDKRIKEFNKETKPMLRILDRRGDLIVVDGTLPKMATHGLIMHKLGWRSLVTST